MIVIDTHTLLWWVSGDKQLSKVAAKSMDIESWTTEVTEIKGVRFISVDNEIGIKSTKLPGEFHKDPADRVIVAIARKLAVPLVTVDEKIIQYPHVQTIW